MRVCVCKPAHAHKIRKINIKTALLLLFRSVCLSVYLIWMFVCGHPIQWWWWRWSLRIKIYILNANLCAIFMVISFRNTCYVRFWMEQFSFDLKCLCVFGNWTDLWAISKGKITSPIDVFLPKFILLYQRVFGFEFVMFLSTFAQSTGRLHYH